jgi:tRNA A37 threonylcarbamoyladenosine dehydratase
VSNYMASSNGAAVIFDPSSFEVGFSATTSEITLLGKLRMGLPKQAALMTRMAVLEVAKADNQAVDKAPAVLKQLFPIDCTGYVLQLASPPPAGEVAQDLRWLNEIIAKQPKVLNLGTKPVAVKDGYITHVWALTFPEETEPGVLGQGWVFLVQGTQTIQVPQGKGKISKQTQHVCYYAQAARNGPEDVRVRVPGLDNLRQHTVAIAGLGALGAPVAIELARNQVGTLHLLDYDIVDPGPSVRWPLGLTAFCQLKTAALAQFIEENYPRTKVKVFTHRIGLPRSLQDIPEGEPRVIDEFLSGTSLLIDASAEIGISHFLSTESRQRAIPYLCLYATPGAWGGLVMRVVPGRTAGCWMCLQYAKDDGTVPIPPADLATGRIQAAGCGDLTFTGAGFDLQNVSLTAVRLAASTLCSSAKGGYAEFEWDIGVLSLVDEQHTPILPSWKTYPLRVHPKCPYCTQ